MSSESRPPAARRPRSRAELLRALDQAARETATQSVFFNQAVAQRLGINVTDLRCMDLLDRHGPMTAGEVARRTGLTTGAITGVIDRLARRGFVRRETDPHDRRRVVIHPTGEHDACARELFASMGTAWQALCASYRTSELAFILEFMQRVAELTRAQTARLQAGTPAARRSARTGTGGVR